MSDISERHPIREAFIKGAESLGVTRDLDCNGAAQEGVAYYQRAIRNGRRHSAATGFLQTARRRPNLRVVTGAHVLRLDVAGHRVLGVTYRRGGTVHQAHAGRETLLSAGTVNSPHSLQLSGFGPAERLWPSPGMTCGVWQMRPQSRGWVRARSADPDAPPAIQPNYLADEADRQAAVDGLRWARARQSDTELPAYRP